jgi:hypothetical protein
MTTTTIGIATMHTGRVALVTSSLRERVLEFALLLAGHNQADVVQFVPTAAGRQTPICQLALYLELDLQTRWTGDGRNQPAAESEQPGTVSPL